MEEKIRERIERAISEKVFPGVVVGVYDAGSKFCIPAGQYVFDEKREITADSIFDVASVTKSIPTSSLILMLVDKGKISIDDEVSQYLSKWKHKDVTIKHLLTQSLALKDDKGVLQLSQLKELTPQEILEAIYGAELGAPPGATYSYSNATSILLGKIIENVTNETLDTVAEREFFQPLHMIDTSFYPKDKKRVVPTEFQDWRGGLVQGVVHDESAYVLSKQGAVGSAGLFSTAPDLLFFIRMIIEGGVVAGKSYLSREIIQKMSIDQLRSIHQRSGLGWELDQGYMGAHSSHIIGKTGFTGCVVMLDLVDKRGLVILSNYTYPHRKPDAGLINQVRRDIANLVFTG